MKLAKKGIDIHDLEFSSFIMCPLEGHVIAMLTFIPCVFCSVSSNFLAEKMQRYIGRICLAFLRCVFSNVSSMYLPESMHNHTGYICLTFLHCVFSNFSSNGLPKQMQITLVAFVRLFSTVHFQMSPHMACFRR